ncbi:MAG: proprotein convertase P-domain-containing protein, partial [Pirellulaceae bacterium]
GGNDRSVARGQSDVNYTSGIHNNRHAIAVAATGDGGAIAPYSNPGAPLLIAAPSNGSGEGITTADLDDSSGTTNGYRRTDFTDSFGGTSSAAPLVSGVIALMLEANPNLTNRDVQHILVESATRDGLSTSGWAANQSGREFSHDYGFGLVNAAGAVTLASNWQPVGPELFVNSGRTNVSLAVADGATVTSTISITPNIKVETVEVVLNASHAQRDDLEVTLEHIGSPTTTSALTKTRASDAGADFNNYVLTSRAHWGESSSGDWSLSVKDGDNNSVTGTFDDWTLRIYGTEITTDKTGPRVARAEVRADQLMEGKVSGFQVQFNEPITPGSFVAADDIDFRPVGGSKVTITSITAVSGSNNTVFDVAFSEQSTAGNYRIDIGPNVTDTAGNNMNQDGDVTNGESTQDKFTDFFTIGNRYVYSNSSTAAIPDFDGSTSGSLDRLINTPEFNIGDVNVLVNVSHNYAADDLSFSLKAPTGSQKSIAYDSTPPGSLHGGNGYLDAIFDDEAGAQVGDSVDYDFTGDWIPRDLNASGATLADFDGIQSSGDWTLTIFDRANSGSAGTFRYASLIITPSGMFDISVDSVTNTDSDRDKVEVTYTVSNPAGGDGTAPSFDLVAYDSTDPFFNINSDTKIGAGFNVTDSNCTDAGSGCLTGGPHTVELDASLFPDPSFGRNQELFSLLIADPGYNVFDTDRFNNQGILSGVTLTPDGTLYVAGNPFTANAVTVTASNVDFNGTNIGYSAATTNDIFFSGSTEVDTFSASGVDENILAFLGVGNDSYTGGNLIDAVQGGPGSDTLNGNNGDDRLYGMIGTDTVDGGAGVDVVSVGPGGVGGQTQSLSGGTGNDYLFIDGTDANDSINVWDPDGTTASIGTSLMARVSSRAGDVTSGTIVNGPDAFGYVAHKTAFQNIDLVLGATNVTTVVNSTSSINFAFDLGTNTFNYYGTSYSGASDLYVSPNGWITFGSAFNFEFDNFDMTTSLFTGRQFLAPFMDDLTTFFSGTGATDSAVLAKLDAGNNQLILEWSDVRNQSIDAVATFQAILELNTGTRAGDIIFNYVDVDFGNATYDNGASATVGTQKVNGGSIEFVNQL